MFRLFALPLDTQRKNVHSRLDTILKRGMNYGPVKKHLDRFVSLDFIEDFALLDSHFGLIIDKKVENSFQNPVLSYLKQTDYFPDKKVRDNFYSPYSFLTSKRVDSQLALPKEIFSHLIVHKSDVFSRFDKVYFSFMQDYLKREYSSEKWTYLGTIKDPLYVIDLK